MIVKEFILLNHFPLVQSYFLQINDLDLGIERDKRIWDRALKVYYKIIDEVCLKVVYKCEVPRNIEGKDLELSNTTISSNAFEILRKEDIKSSYVYMMTIGRCNIQSERILDQLLCDSWGTAFIDAGRELFKQYLENEMEGIISESFGPGFYGMSVWELYKFFEIINTDILNLYINQKGMLVPEKSCAGIFFQLKEGSKLPPSACDSCKGNLSGCQFCNIYKKA